MYRAKSANRGFLRGGNWNNGSNAGAFYLNLNNTPTNTNTNIGFRVARSLRSTTVLVPLAGMPVGPWPAAARTKDLPFGFVLAGSSAKDIQPARPEL